jgi:hypothetical protein
MAAKKSAQAARKFAPLDRKKQRMSLAMIAPN